MEAPGTKVHKIAFSRVPSAVTWDIEDVVERHAHALEEDANATNWREYTPALAGADPGEQGAASEAGPTTI